MIHLQRLTEVLGSTAGKSLISLVDQAIISGLNFTVAFVLARTCSQEEYGSFALAFSIILFVNGVSYTLISTPMMVLGATKKGEEAREYFSALFAGQVVLSLGSAILLACVVVIFYLSGSGSVLLNTLIGMVVCIPIIQLQDFLRRVLLTRLQTAKALVNDALLCCLQVTGLWFLYITNMQGEGGTEQSLLSPRNAFFVIAAASMFAVLLGVRYFREFVGIRLSNILKYARENWRYARWGVVSMIGGLATLHATTWVIGIIGGEVAVAEVEAPRLLAGFMNVLVFGLANVFTPRTAAIFESQRAIGLRRFLKKSYVLWSAICIAFAGFMLFFGKQTLGLAFGTRYADLSNILYMWTAYYVVVGLRQVPGYGVAAIKRPDIGVWISLVVGAITLVLTTFLMHHGGVALVVAGRIIGEALTLVMMHIAIFSTLKRMDGLTVCQGAKL